MPAFFFRAPQDFEAAVVAPGEVDQQVFWFPEVKAAEDAFLFQQDDDVFRENAVFELSGGFIEAVDRVGLGRPEFAAHEIRELCGLIPFSRAVKRTARSPALSVESSMTQATSPPALSRASIVTAESAARTRGEAIPNHATKEKARRRGGVNMTRG